MMLARGSAMTCESCTHVLGVVIMSACNCKVDGRFVVPHLLLHPGMFCWLRCE